MKLIFKFLKDINSKLIKLRNNLQTGYLSQTIQSNMTGKHISDETELLPNKKFCTEEKIQNVTEIKEKKPKIKRFALLLGYFGDNYYGIQKNDGFRTIEGELLDALEKSKLIKPEAVKEPYLVQFQITARTDKGVSAAKQVVSLKMAGNYCVKTINEYLPNDIRLFSIRRVTNGFFCKKECIARTYSYTLPTFALAPELHTEYPENYRIDEETFEKVNSFLLSYVGTRNFHNFTSKKLYIDPSAKRYIIHIKTGKPFIDGIEFVTLTVKGQSFMLHQIRKMVAYLIITMKGLTPPNIESEIWTDKKFSIPLAPGLGLMLENVHFDYYNKKYESDGIHESLAWEDLNDEIEPFKKEIISHIIKRELKEKSMFNWIQHIHEHCYQFNTNVRKPEISLKEIEQQEQSSAV